MNMPTPTRVHLLAPRSVGLEPLSPHATASYDPAQIAWIDAERADDLDPDSDDPLAAGADALARRGLSLRPWRRSDLQTFRVLLDDPEVWAHLPEPYPDPLDTESAAVLIGLANSLDAQLIRAALCDGIAVGQVRLDLSPANGTAEISYWLGRDYWAQGIGKALVAGTVRRACDRIPDLLKLVAKVKPENTASARLLRRAGFTACTTPPLPGFDDWHWFALRRQDLGRGIRSEASP